ASADETASIRVWDPNSGKELRRFGKPFEHLHCCRLAFAPDSRTLAAAALNGVTVWDVLSGKLLPQAAHGACSATFSPDGKLLAVGGCYRAVCLHRTGTGKAVPFERDPCPGGFGYVLSVAFSPDGKLLASADGV